MIYILLSPLIILVLVIIFVLIPKGVISIRTRSSSFTEKKYLKILNNDMSISSVITHGTFMNPFDLKIDAMEKLILFDIEDDPVYTTLELQAFNDKMSRGLIILMYRRDKGIDVYYTAGINHDFYKGTSNASVLEFEPEEYCFKKSDDEFRFLIKFQDKNGAEIYIKADEYTPGKEYFSILAPAGDMIDNFTSFPLFFMKETAFFEKEHTVIYIRIGQHDRTPVSIPIAINGKFVYLSRYCLEPVVASINENYRGELQYIDSAGNDTIQYSFVNNDDSEGKLYSIEKNELNHKVVLKFYPPIPNILSLNDGDKIKGRFSTSVDGIDGVLGGEYSIEKVADKHVINMQPRKGWQPEPGKKWFRKYIWNSVVSVNKNKIYADSKWVKL